MYPLDGIIKFFMGSFETYEEFYKSLKQTTTIFVWI